VVGGTRFAIGGSRFAIFASLILPNFAAGRLFVLVAPVFARFAAQRLPDRFSHRFPLLATDRLPNHVSLVGSHRGGRVAGNPILGETSLEPGHFRRLSGGRDRAARWSRART
jgi:hypothetical protein